MNTLLKFGLGLIKLGLSFIGFFVLLIIIVLILFLFL